MPTRPLLAQKQHRPRSSVTRLGGIALGFLAAVPASRAQASLPSGTPQQWVQQASLHEQSIIQNDGEFPLRYRIRKVDAKGDTTREVIESRQGTVARLIERNGQPIMAAEDKAEQSRLQDILKSPDDFIRHHSKDASARGYSTGLVKLLPTSMRLSYTPGQPQPPGASPSSPQVVIDYEPDPSFKPPTTVSQIPTGIAGRFWIDQRTGHLTRAEAHVLQPVNFGWGVLAQIHAGGTILFEQSEVAPDHWAYSHLEEHVVIRALLFKTVPENTTMTSFDFRTLPAPLSVQDAVHMLLAMPIQTR